MKFGEAVISGYRNAFVYSGRSTRSEYWWFTLFGVILSTLIVVGSIMYAFGGVGANPTDEEAFDAFFKGMMYALIACWIVVGLPGVALGVRRLHDIGRGGKLLEPGEAGAGEFGIVGIFAGDEADEHQCEFAISGHAAEGGDRSGAAAGKVPDGRVHVVSSNR